MKLFTAIATIIGCIFIVVVSINFIKPKTKGKFLSIDWASVQKIELISRETYTVTNKTEIYSICNKINNYPKKKESSWKKRKTTGAIIFWSESKRLLSLGCYTDKVYSVDDYYFSMDLTLLDDLRMETNERTITPVGSKNSYMGKIDE